MELENTDKISSLFQSISLYEDSKNNNSSSSNHSGAENSIKLKESTIDEKYFHIKLMKLLGITKESSFSNVQIEKKKFLQDIEIFLQWAIKEKGIDEKEALKKKNEITFDLNSISKIELDSFFVNVPGKNIKEFLNNMKSYSFPIEENKIIESTNYMVLIESTHSINSVLKKKAEQMRRYPLFFNLFNKFFIKNDEYLKFFHLYFFKKIFKSQILI